MTTALLNSPTPTPARQAVPRECIALQTLTVAGHELTVYVESPPLLDAMLADIESARQRIWLETYIFFNDEGGSRIANALKRRAREGLDVRVHYDAIGSVSTPAAFFAEMQADGVKVHAYHSLLEGLKRFMPLRIMNRRNHRKLLVIDDKAGYFGGMNIVDNVENVKELKKLDKPRSSGWRDVHVRVVGPQQRELVESFERSWASAHGKPPRRRSRSARRAHLMRAVSGRGADESIHFYDSAPHDRLSRAGRIFTHLIRKSQHEIMMSMAYFIPVGTSMRALMAARRRRVGIFVIVPGKSDVKIVQRATAYLYDRLIRRGLRIYERRERMLHSKMMVVDQLYTLVGSANLDPRSMHTNLEFLAVIRSEALARVMVRICRFEISQSERITMRACRQISWWNRLLNRLAWGLRWWL